MPYICIKCFFRKIIQSWNMRDFQKLAWSLNFLEMFKLLKTINFFNYCMIIVGFYDWPSWWWCQWCRELDPVSFFKYDLELGSSLLKLCCWMLTLTTQSCSQAFNRCVPSKVWRCTTAWIHSNENFVWPKKSWIFRHPMASQSILRPFF